MEKSDEKIKNGMNLSSSDLRNKSSYLLRTTRESNYLLAENQNVTYLFFTVDCLTIEAQ